MVRASAKAVLRGVEPAEIIAVIPEILRAWRAVTFDVDHAVETATGPREGLRVVAGEHPRPGVRYRVVPEPDPAAETGTPVHVVDLLEDDRDRVRVAFASSLEFSASAELTCPQRPQRLTAQVRARTLSGRLAGGPATIDLDADLAALAAGGTDQLEARLRHRAVQGRAVARVSARRDGFSEIEIRVRGRGRGVLRPVIGLGSLLVNRRFKQGLRAGAAKAAAQIEQVAAAARREFGPNPDPADVASTALAALLDDVAERVPAHLPGDDAVLAGLPV